MNVYVVVEYKDVDAINPTNGEETYITETKIMSVFSSKQDANFECKELNNSRTENNILYSIENYDMI